MATLVTPTEKAEKTEKNPPPTPEEKTDRKQRARADDKFKIFSGRPTSRWLTRSVSFWGCSAGRRR